MTKPSLEGEIATLERIVDTDDPNWSEYERILCSALALTTSASDLRALLGRASVGEGMFEAAPSLAVAREWLDCVERFSGADRASAWAMGLRSAIPDICSLLTRRSGACRDVWRSAMSERRGVLLSFATSDESLVAQLAFTLATFDDLDAPEREWLLAQLARKQPNGAAMICSALHVGTLGTAPLEKTCKRLVAKPPKKADDSKQWSLTGAIAACLLIGITPPGLKVALGVALAFAAPMPSSWTEPALVPPLTAGALLIALVVSLDELFVSKEALVQMLCAATPSSALEAQRRAELLVTLAFSKEATPITERVVPAEPAERVVLEALAQPAFRDAHAALRRIGLWSHAGLVEWMAERGPRFRHVSSLSGEPHHALGVYRAAIAGRVPIDRAVELIIQGASTDDVAGLLFQSAERAFTVATANTPERRRRERDLAMRLISWLRERCDDYAALLERYAVSPFCLAPILLLAVLDAAARGMLVMGAAHERLVHVGVLENPERGDLEPLFAAVPRGAELFARHQPPS